MHLTGYVVDADGRFAGRRVVGDADGVAVELTYGDQVVARTTTADGVYTFTGLGPGAYVARSRVIGNIGDETRPLTISSYDVAAGDTLRRIPRGDLYPVPNPFVQSSRQYFQLADTLWVDVRILDMAATPSAPCSSTRSCPG